MFSQLSLFALLSGGLSNFAYAGEKAPANFMGQIHTTQISCTINNIKGEPPPNRCKDQIGKITISSIFINHTSSSIDITSENVPQTLSWTDGLYVLSMNERHTDNGITADVSGGISLNFQDSLSGTSKIQSSIKVSNSERLLSSYDIIIEAKFELK